MSIHRSPRRDGSHNLLASGRVPTPTLQFLHCKSCRIRTIASWSNLFRRGTFVLCYRPAMARKWITPVSIIVFILGIGMVVWSLSRTSGSTTSPTQESSVTSVGASDSDTSSTSTTTGGATPTLVPGSSSTASSTATTRAPSSSSAPTSVVPSVTVRPVSPGASAVVTTTLAPLSVPPLALTPGVVAPPACVSFADCAQKMFSEWLAGGTGARTRAQNYGTPEAVRALFEFRTIGVVWNPTVIRSTSLKWVAAATSHPKGIEFNFTSGQTGFKVQSVVWY